MNLTQFFPPSSDNNSISKIYNNIANVYYDKKDFATAKAYYKKSIDLAKGINPLSTSNYYRNYASTTEELGNNKETNIFYQKAIQLAKDNAGKSLDLAVEDISYWETREYVKKVMGNYYSYLAIYGKDFH